MNEHGILYTDPMIQAKEKGIKTVTRRPIKPQPEALAKEQVPDWDGKIYKKNAKTTDGKKGVCFCTDPELAAGSFMGCTYPSEYGKPGDLLYTKENFQIIGDMQFEQSVHVTYRQDGQSRWVQLTNDEWEKFRQWKLPYGKKSKLFMFKSLARYWDEITEIEAERVQDISESEARNEGLYREWDGKHHWFLNYGRKGELFRSAVRSFQTLWDSMYAGTEFAWKNNPWVWVIRYRPVDAEKRAMKNELREGIL